MKSSPSLPRLVIIDDDKEFCQDMEDVLGGRYQLEVANTAETGLTLVNDLRPEVVLLDIDLGEKTSGLDVLELLITLDERPEVLMLSKSRDFNKVVGAIKRGAFHYLVKRPNPDELINLIERARTVRANQWRLAALQDETLRDIVSFIQADKATRRLVKQIQKIAPTDTTVLVVGESGSGKEQVARLIHSLSQRRNEVLTTTHCGALPDQLIESELFGHEKGAFTGAERLVRGRFEMANGGTLFLDEVGYSSREFQIKLLRVLEDRSFQRLGSSQTIQTDVRLIAASSKDLKTATEQGEFLPELLYRLNVVRLDLLPLRERSDDILPLARLFLEEFASHANKECIGFTPAAEQALVDHAWPGNVRELRNRIERAVIFWSGGLMGLGEILSTDIKSSASAVTYAEAKEHAMHDFKLKFLTERLQQAQGNISAAARDCGLQRQALQRMVKECGIDPDEFRR